MAAQAADVKLACAALAVALASACASARIHVKDDARVEGGMRLELKSADPALRDALFEALSANGFNLGRVEVTADTRYILQLEGQCRPGDTLVVSLIDPRREERLLRATLVRDPDCPRTFFREVSNALLHLWQKRL